MHAFSENGRLRNNDRNVVHGHEHVTESRQKRENRAYFQAWDTCSKALMNWKSPGEKMRLRRERDGQMDPMTLELPCILSVFVSTRSLCLNGLVPVLRCLDCNLYQRKWIVGPQISSMTRLPFPVPKPNHANMALSITDPLWCSDALPFGQIMRNRRHAGHYRVRSTGT